MTAGQTAIFVTVVILTVLSVGLVKLYSPTVATFNAGTGLGVNSGSARNAEFFTSLFVVYMPISLVWLGILLTIITSQYYFTIPSLATIPTCLIISGLEAFWPAKISV